MISGRYFSRSAFLLWMVSGVFVLSACAPVDVPDARALNVPTPKVADTRKQAVNERPDSVMYLPLGEDVLLPEVSAGEPLPMEEVGPFELRSETLAGALQLILADYDISIAFETDEGLTRRVTVANLKGPLNNVVEKVCSLADLYCSYEGGILVIKDTQTFTVTLPPIGGSTGEGGEASTDFLDDVAEGLGAILGEEADPIVDPTTRSIIYTATQRTAGHAERYFQRLRANTAMIVFEVYIWEVQLNAGNTTGIAWDQLDTFGKFNASIAINGAPSGDFTNPVSIGLPTTQSIGATPTDLVQFLAQFGAVKSISQPQITVLSGSQAELRVADTENYVSQIQTTLTDTQSTTSVSTDTVNSGFELTIGSTWDKSTVYANINLTLTSVIDILNFAFSDSGDDEGTDTNIQLPQTSERELNTSLRVRPGDSILIGGLVRESDDYSERGPGLTKPIIPDSRTSTTENLELVILMRPRVVVYTGADDQRYKDFVSSKKQSAISPALKASAGDEEFGNIYSDAPVLEPVSEAPSDPLPEPLPVPVEDPLMPSAPVAPIQSEPVPLSAAPAPVSPAVEETFMVPVSEPMVATSKNIEPVVAPIAESDGSSVTPPARPSFSGRLGSGYVSRSSSVYEPSADAPLSPVMVAPQDAEMDDSVELLPVDSSPVPPVIVPEEPFVPIYPATGQPSANVPVVAEPQSAYESYDYYVPSN